MPDNTEQVEDRFERAKRIALEAVEESRVQLMMKFRFLDVALWKMELRPTTVMGRYTLATDGAAVYFLETQALDMGGASGIGHSESNAKPGKNRKQAQSGTLSQTL